MDRYDRISSLFLVGVSLTIIGGSLAYSVGTWSKPGPAFLPLGCGVIMRLQRDSYAVRTLSS